MTEDGTLGSWQDGGYIVAFTMGQFIGLMVDSGDDIVLARVIKPPDPDLAYDTQVMEIEVIPAPLVGRFVLNSEGIPAYDRLQKMVDRGVFDCIWSYDEDHDSWDGECGLKWQLEVGSPLENGMDFCPGCGKSLIEQWPEGQDDE